MSMRRLSGGVLARGSVRDGSAHDTLPWKEEGGMADLPAGEFADVLRAALAAASPELFGGTPTLVSLSVVADTLCLSEPATGGANGVHRKSRSERLDVDPRRPTGPYRTAVAPAPGPRVVRALVGNAAAFTFRDVEVVWSPTEPQSFTLAPRANRSLTEVTGLRVVYAADAVSAATAYRGRVTLALAGAPSDVYRARDLAIALLALEADTLVAHTQTTRREGDYVTTHQATGLSTVSLDLEASDTDALVCRLAVDLHRQVEVERALRDGEGTPIRRILLARAEPDAGPVAIDSALAD
jgi:hypothetical protein